MAETTLNMQLLLRRDDVFNTSYKLAAGEPGFEISTNILKIGDGVKTWAELPIANKAQIDALIKVTDDKVVALTEVVGKLDDTYATDAEVEGVRKALDEAKLDKATYETYIATHAMTDTEITTAIGNVDAKFASYRTSAAQDEIDATFALKSDLKTVTDEIAGYGDIVTHNASEFATAEQGAKADAAAVKTEVDAAFLLKADKSVVDAMYTNTQIDGFISTTKSEAIAAAKTETETQVNSLANGAVKTNTDAISAINNEETGILANAKAYVDEEDVFVTDMTTINTLGGIAAGADLNGLTTHEVLKKLLYPYVDATVGNATGSPNGGTYEKGATKTITSVSITVTKKSEPITSVALYNGSTLIEEKTGDAVKNGGTITFSGLSVEVPTNGNQLTVKVTYPDANGNAKTVEKKTTALTFVYPYYMGSCAAGTAIDETLVESLTKKIEGKGNKSNSFTVSDGHMVFAYPKAHGVLKSILDPNNFETIGNYTRNEVSVTGLDGTAQTYYVYVSGATTVSGFVVNFKY